MSRFACFAIALLFAAPRIVFVRTLPARHDIGAEHAAVIYALGDNDKVMSFVEMFLAHTNREGSILRVDDAVDRSRHLFGGKPTDAQIRHLNKNHPADVYLGIHHFTCDVLERSGEGSTYDYDGTRVKRKQVWADATCHARIDVMQPATMKRLYSFEVKGEGTSARMVEMSEEDRGVAIEQAARFAALEASEAITPRRIRESIELNDEAPMFDRGNAMIEAGRLDAARSLWESEVRRDEASAPAHFDLAAVCDAIGDLQCAEEHFRAAARIAPGDARYRTEMDRFRKRQRLMR